MKKISFCNTILMTVLLLLLSGCGTVGLTPEDAAVKALSQGTHPGLTVNPESIEVFHTVELTPRQAIEVLTFEGARQELGAVSCIYSYQVNNNFFSWQPGSGGGSCREDAPDQVSGDLEVSGGTTAGHNKQDPGFSQAFGFINNPEITRVQVTWDDRVTTEAEVNEKVFVAVRSGQFDLHQVEGLDAEERLIYSFTRPANGANSP